MFLGKFDVFKFIFRQSTIISVIIKLYELSWLSMNDILGKWPKAHTDKAMFVCMFDLILYVPSTVFQLNRDGSSWVEPVLR